MADKETIIVVGVTREDEYGNLWVTPKGGGDEVKIGSKRSGLHSLFQQGKAIMLHWETYKNRTYVADAKAVEGELPEAQKLDSPPPQSGEEPLKKTREQEIAEHVWFKELGEWLRIWEQWPIEKRPKSFKALKDSYFAFMWLVLPIKIEDK